MIKFSSRMNLLKGSAIRELLALANKPEVLSFAGGMPAPELFPVEKIKAATDAVLEEQGRVALRTLPFHKAVLNGELPYTIGGGIGQSRLCMLLLGSAHIGEVQASVWDESTREACAKAGIPLL